MKLPAKPAPESATSAFQLLSQVGLTMVGCILAGLWAGIKLDSRFGSRGIVTALGILTGILAGTAATGFLLYRSIPWKH